ncbi:LD-carboxypeptidase [Parvularcula lutaonensis]|uniref:LD-carboxypeptidase n=1 Tax=Parvularcula lutaonensis TaxID=491923 RepID=A0ABV7MBL7_9PROT|nr:LD-carboxypeptidase [Parvularcula lutaonensis]GGY47749.1 putative carboxypeptidase [Parvularcula lutaonensis]
MKRVAVVAPSRSLDRKAAEAVKRLVETAYPDRLELAIHPQCFAASGHFAGDDQTRAGAFIDVANDPAVDAVWFARGGYGACRILDQVVPSLGDAAKAKTWLGYSDGGYLLAALDRAGIGRSVHGPVVADIIRADGEAAARRALDFLAGEQGGKEPSVGEGSAVALTLSILASLVAGPHVPDLKGRVLMIEEVGEHLYAIDRMLYTVFSSGKIDGCAGLRLGRFNDVPENDIDFGEEPEAMVRRWCEEYEVPYLGRVDIGHDAGNKIVPFR